MKNISIPFCLPKNISTEVFLNTYWQKKPLLIKQGLPQLIDMFEPDDILDLALDPEASARVIKQTVKNNPPINSNDFDWQLINSPLDEDIFENLPQYWTVLVQNLEQWSPDIGQLWKAFDFIPQWQRDDIMVSFAPAGGSVGKHYDDYDVFLAQGYGQRRWQLGKYCDENTAFLENQPIRIFDDMGDIIFDEVLEAGDVLYVPPKLSHYGVAESDCLTFSFGFRRPNIAQLLDSMADIATSEASLFIPLLLPQVLQSSGELTDDSINHIKNKLIDTLNSEVGSQLITQAVSEVVSKREYDVLIPEDGVNAKELQQYLDAGAYLLLDYSSRLIYTNSPLTIYANGQQIMDINELETSLLKKLADGETIYQQDIINLPINRILEWLENGWVWLNTDALD